MFRAATLHLSMLVWGKLEGGTRNAACFTREINLETNQIGFKSYWNIQRKPHLDETRVKFKKRIKFGMTSPECNIEIKSNAN